MNGFKEYLKGYVGGAVVQTVRNFITMALQYHIKLTLAVLLLSGHGYGWTDSFLLWFP
jgi:hypothetical protein